MTEIGKNLAVVIRRSDGKFFQGCGYGGPGNPVPYWGSDIWKAKTYRTPAGAAAAMKRFGGSRGAAEADVEGRPVRWLGFLAYGRSGWRIIPDVRPKDFDPNDYEMNNGQL